MKCFLLVLLAAVAANASAQQFPVEHATQAQQESLAMAERVQGWRKDSDDRHEHQYAENRQRCESALLTAEQRGKAATFSCSERGFKAGR